MTGFNIEELELNDAFAISSYVFSDKRGSFVKSFEREIYRRAGIEFEVHESFVTVSAKSVIRGLHFQLNNPQAKLICLISGKAWDVIVDLRRSSPTYKKWISIELNCEGKNSVYVPKGFAHGFAALSDNTTILYQCQGAYDRATDTGIVYSDATLGIQWPRLDEKPIVSDRDMSLMTFDQFEHVSGQYIDFM